MIKLIKTEKGINIGKEKRLIVINDLPEIKNINLDEDKEKLTYKYYSEIDINNPVLDDSVKHLDNLWKELKKEIQKLTLFEAIEKTFYYIDYIFRLNDSYKNDEGKICLPLILEPYLEEVIIYVIDSCVNGKVKGKFIVEKATNEMMSFAKRRRNESEYNDWRDDIFDKIAHDFNSSYHYETVAMEKLIKKIENKNIDDAMSEVIDFLFFDKDMLKYLLITNHFENEVYIKMYTSLGEKNIRRKISSKFNEFIIYKNIPMEEVFIETSNYKLDIDNKGVNVFRT